MTSSTARETTRFVKDYLLLQTVIAEIMPGFRQGEVAVPTLVVQGDLDPILAAMAAALRPGGLLVATLEALDDGDERNIVLQVHGRYAHRGGYAQAMLERHGLRIETFTRDVLREELAEPVQGWVFSAFKVA